MGPLGHRSGSSNVSASPVRFRAEARSTRIRSFSRMLTLRTTLQSVPSRRGASSRGALALGLAGDTEGEVVEGLAGGGGDGGDGGDGAGRSTSGGAVPECPVRGGGSCWQAPAERSPARKQTRKARIVAHRTRRLVRTTPVHRSSRAAGARRTLQL